MIFSFSYRSKELLRIRGLRKRNHCPHEFVRAIYGKEIQHTPGNRVLQCIDCTEYLDGEPSLAESRTIWKWRFDD